MRSPRRRRPGGTAAFVDAEHALDPVYAKKLGVDIDELIVSQPDTGEQALEITDTLVRSNAIDVLVIDSVAALVPRAEIEGEMGDSHVGLQARLMSQALRKITGSISRSKCTLVIFINQIRMKIGVMYGNPGDDDRRQRAQILRHRSASTSAAPARSRIATISSATRPA
jgi:recombination protein RecA